MINRSKNRLNDIPVHGFQLFCLGIFLFFCIIGLVIFSYYFFITTRIYKSPEYLTAHHFVANSPVIAKELSAPLKKIIRENINVSEKDGYGLSEIDYVLFLENGIKQKIKIGLVKVSDFWIVYKVLLNPNLPMQKYLVSSYNQILQFLHYIEKKQYQQAFSVMEIIKKELRDPFLITFLEIRLNIVGKNFTRAQQQIDEILPRAKFSSLALIYTNGLLLFQQQNLKRAINLFLEVEKYYDKYYAHLDNSTIKNAFEQNNKDAFVMLFDFESVLAMSREALATSYIENKKYDQALIWSEKAIKQAIKINVPRAIHRGTFIKANSLYILKKFSASLVELGKITQDKEAESEIKAWAYYFKGLNFSQQKNNKEMLRCFEAAFYLDPYNSFIRQNAILQILKSQQPTNKDIAKVWALRGLDIGVDTPIFQDLLKNLSIF